MTIKGTVNNAAGQPLAGATIEILTAAGNRKQPPAGTTTDQSGVFEIEVKKGEVLEASFVGHGKSQVKVENDAPKNFYLDANPGTGPEVPVQADKIKPVVWLAGGALLLWLFMGND